MKAVGVAVGGNWPDALVGAATMGRIGGPLLLTDGRTLTDANLAAARAAASASGTLTSGWP